MALTDAGRAAMVYWGTIQEAVARRASTAEIWDAIRAAAAAEPGGAPLPSVTGVGEVRSAAAQIRNSRDALTSAREVETSSGLSQAIDSRMMSVAPWSRDRQVLDTLADYQVRFEARLTTPLGREVSQMLTARFGAGELPATVGELVDALGRFGTRSGSLPDGTFAGIGEVSILAV